MENTSTWCRSTAGPQPENMTGFANGYNAAAKYLGMTTGSAGAAATADLTSAYSWRWLTQPAPEWPAAITALGWELEPSPEILRMFAGTTRYKMRPWWPNYNYSNYVATCRAPFNPMQFVYRTAGLVRGPHPYGFVVDDAKKDDAVHLYQWVAMLNGGVWRAAVPNLPPHQIALAFRPRDPKADPAAAKPAIEPQAGEPLLLVCALGLPDSGDARLPLFQVETQPGPPVRTNEPTCYDRLVVNRRAGSANFRVLLLPVLAGQPLPRISASNSEATVTWADQEDRLVFRPVGPRTQVMVLRDKQTILQSN